MYIRLSKPTYIPICAKNVQGVPQIVKKHEITTFASVNVIGGTISSFFDIHIAFNINGSTGHNCF